MDFQKRRIQLLLAVVGIIALSITADKCRQLVGKESSSKSGEFTILNCLDGGSGTLACVVKEGVKLYICNIRSAHVEKARHKAVEQALVDALSQGLVAKEAASLAQKEGAKAAKLATRQAKRIIGPIIASGWDFFEAIYYGGTLTEGFLRGTGTLFGTYIIGFHGEQKFGRFGYLVGSELGSWIGGRVGLMAYDVVIGVHYLLTDPPQEPKVYDPPPPLESSENDLPSESSENDPPLESSENVVTNVFQRFFGSSESDKTVATQIFKSLFGSSESEETVAKQIFKSLFGSSESVETNFYDASNSEKGDEASHISENPTYTSSESSEASHISESPTYTSSESSDASHMSENPTYSSSESSEGDDNIYEDPSFWGSEGHEEL